MTGMKSREDFVFSEMDGRKDFLAEWSEEVSRILSALKRERNKVRRYMDHLKNRIDFIEKNFQDGSMIQTYSKEMNNLKFELSRLDEEIKSKEKLLEHINT